MSDLEGMINGILSNPEEMKKIMDMAGKLMGTEDGQTPSMPSGSAPSETPSLESLLPGVDIASLASTAQTLLGNDTIRKLLSGPLVKNIIGETLHPNNDKRELFNALKPWLSVERRARLEKAIIFAKAMRVVGVATPLIRGG
ncbi:MAG: hypothetical protein CVU91_10240 [Firmicutes bacterium HGW-Firmicutes-16]|nr:MAG: hypothetical protein CVU91_10240 [Firmicutes bacterium HGW-Firmicutes-16]